MDPAPSIVEIIEFCRREYEDDLFGTCVKIICEESGLENEIKFYKRESDSYSLEKCIVMSQWFHINGITLHKTLKKTIIENKCKLQAFFGMSSPSRKKILEAICNIFELEYKEPLPIFESDDFDKVFEFDSFEDAEFEALEITLSQKFTNGSDFKLFYKSIGDFPLDRWINSIDNPIAQRKASLNMNFMSAETFLGLMFLLPKPLMKVKSFLTYPDFVISEDFVNLDLVERFFRTFPKIKSHNFEQISRECYYMLKERNGKGERFDTLEAREFILLIQNLPDKYCNVESIDYYPEFVLDNAQLKLMEMASKFYQQSKVDFGFIKTLGVFESCFSKLENDGLTAIQFMRLVSLLSPLEFKKFTFEDCLYLVKDKKELSILEQFFLYFALIPESSSFCAEISNIFIKHFPNAEFTKAADFMKFVALVPSTLRNKTIENIFKFVSKAEKENIAILLSILNSTKGEISTSTAYLLSDRLKEYNGSVLELSALQFVQILITQRFSSLKSKLADRLEYVKSNRERKIINRICLFVSKINSEHRTRQALEFVYQFFDRRNNLSVSKILKHFKYTKSMLILRNCRFLFEKGSIEEMFLNLVYDKMKSGNRKFTLQCARKYSQYVKKEFNGQSVIPFDNEFESLLIRYWSSVRNYENLSPISSPEPLIIFE